MRFTVMPAAGVGLLFGQAMQQEHRLPPLDPVRTAENGEVTGAATMDGEWIFVRLGDGNWATGHLPTETEVRRGLADLGACRRYAASGRAREDLDRLAETAG